MFGKKNTIFGENWPILWVFHRFVHFSTVILHTYGGKWWNFTPFTPKKWGKGVLTFHIFNGLFHRKTAANP